MPKPPATATGRVPASVNQRDRGGRWISPDGLQAACLQLVEQASLIRENDSVRKQKVAVPQVGGDVFVGRDDGLVGVFLLKVWVARARHERGW